MGKIIKINPPIKPNQIWLCSDSNRKERRALVVMEVETMDNIEFTRVMPISFEIEFAAKDDIIIDDSSILDRPFIIEYWNEQPISTSLLVEFIKIIHIPEQTEITEIFELSQEQKNFRKSEIENTEFIRDSVLKHVLKEETKGRIVLYKGMRYLSVAASLILIFLIWQPDRMSNDEVFEKYNFEIELVLPVGDTLITKGASSKLSRGLGFNNINFEKLNDSEKEIANSALNYYSLREYKKSSFEFSKLENLLQKSSHLFFYQSVSELESNQQENAIKHFIVLSSQVDDELKDITHLYLALGYIKNNQRSQAKNILHYLKESQDPEMSNKAKSILKELRRF